MTYQEYNTLLDQYDEKLVRRGATPHKMDTSLPYGEFTGPDVRNHVRWMIIVARELAVDPQAYMQNLEKAHRWLGWIQAATFFLHIFTIDETRNHVIDAKLPEQCEMPFGLGTSLDVVLGQEL